METYTCAGEGGEKLGEKRMKTVQNTLLFQTRIVRRLTSDR